MGQGEILVSVHYLPTHFPAGGDFLKKKSGCDDLLHLLLYDMKKVHALNVLPFTYMPTHC